MRRLPDAVEDSLKGLPDGLIEHIECVREIARELASIHSIDGAQVEPSQLGTDGGRERRDLEALEAAGGLGFAGPLQPARSRAVLECTHPLAHAGR